MKTRKEVEKLKQLWLEDKTAFDLTTVEGYEDYQEELALFVAEHNPPPTPGIGGLLTGGLAALAQSMFQPSLDNLKDRTAFEIIRRLLKDAPDDLTGEVQQQYYENIGYDAYQRTHYILNGRERFLADNCDCPACRSGYKPGEPFR